MNRKNLMDKNSTMTGNRPEKELINVRLTLNRIKVSK